MHRSQQDAHAFCQEFFRWYNDEHYHSGIGLLTPASVHYGGADETLAKRQAVLDAAYEHYPERFVNKAPSPPDGPTAVWINPPASAVQANGDAQTSLVEIQTPSGPIAPKTELDISRLTSAETLARPAMPDPTDVNLNNAAHENGLPKIHDLGKPDASLTHPRPGYPLASCVPAELASVSPGENESTQYLILPQPLNTRVMPKKIPGGLGAWSPNEAANAPPDELRYTKFDRELSQSR